MSTKLPGYDETVICPYNKCHVILRHRIQTHLVKCARANPDIKLETCPFDVTHRVRAEELSAHKEDCPSRGTFDRYMYSVNTSSGSQPAPPVQEQRAAPRRPVQRNDDDEECWDHYNTPTYEPQKYAMNANVLRQPMGMTPSERKKFADAERKRLSELTRTRPGLPNPR